METSKTKKSVTQTKFERVYEDINNGTESNSYPTFTDGVKSLEITDAIAQSSKNSAWVKIA